VDQTGSVVREGVVDSDPEAIATFVRSNAPGAVQIGLETGPTELATFHLASCASDRTRAVGVCLGDASLLGICAAIGYIKTARLSYQYTAC
jgi:hypothetical protein